MWQNIFNALQDPGFQLHVAYVSIVVLGTWISFMLSWRWLPKVAARMVRKSANSWDDALVNNRVFNVGFLLIPAVVCHQAIRLLPDYAAIVHKGIQFYTVIVLTILVNRLLFAGLEIYERYPIAQQRPLKNYTQLVSMFVSLVGCIVLLSFILDTSAWGLVSGLGALTAVILLVFRDTLLSFVAGLQIAGNDLLRKGDWIEVPSFKADGTVVDVALHTIKVQNFDNTIVSVPTYKLMENSFRNWRGMFVSGGRRIKRSIFIDQASIRFADDGLLERLRSVKLLEDYLTYREREIFNFNRNQGGDTGNPLNGRHLTNIGLFRAYVLAYLKQNNHLHNKDFTLMVRQLEPEADKGLALQLYCFATDTNWVRYEDTQSDIFDHLLAALPLFDLRAYQRVGAHDLRRTDYQKQWAEVLGEDIQQPLSGQKTRLSYPPGKKHFRTAVQKTRRFPQSSAGRRHRS